MNILGTRSTKATKVRLDGSSVFEFQQLSFNYRTTWHPFLIKVTKIPLDGIDVKLLPKIVYWSDSDHIRDICWRVKGNYKIQLFYQRSRIISKTKIQSNYST